MIRFSRNIFYLSQQCTASKWHFLYQENSRRDGTDFVQYLVKITDGRIPFWQIIRISVCLLNPNPNTREVISFLLEGSLSDWSRHQNRSRIHHRWSITVWWSYLTHSGVYWTKCCTFRRLLATQTIGPRLFWYSPKVEFGKDGSMPHPKKCNIFFIRFGDRTSPAVSTSYGRGMENLVRIKLTLGTLGNKVHFMSMIASDKSNNYLN